MSTADRVLIIIMVILAAAHSFHVAATNALEDENKLLLQEIETLHNRLQSLDDRCHDRDMELKRMLETPVQSKQRHTDRRN